MNILLCNGKGGRRALMLLLAFLLAAPQLYAKWEFYEKSVLPGSISGTVKKGRSFKLQSGSVYEVTDFTLQLVLELSPEATVLSDGQQFKLIVEGFDEPLICKQLVPPRFRLSPSGGATRADKDSYESTNVKGAISGTITKDKVIQMKSGSVYQVTGRTRQRVRERSPQATVVREGKQFKLIIDGFDEPLICKQLVAPIRARTTRATAAESVIESQVEDDFEGWEGETIVKLVNGQIWQQTEYHYEYHYAFMPDVLIYKRGSTWKMKVEGVDEAVGVERLK